MVRKAVSITALLAAIFMFCSAGIAAETPQRPRIAPPCKQCHAPDENVLRGAFTSVSKKADTIQMQIGPATWLVKFDDDTKLIGAEKFSAIPKEKEIAIAVRQRDGELYAVSLSVKPPAKLPAEKVVKADEVAKLVAAGTGKGGFTLVDSRPMARYIEGHIPGAVSLYDAEFEKLKEKLPKEKDGLLVFYCAGPT